MELLKAMKVFDSQDWAAEDDEDIRSHDRNSLLAIHSKFSDILKDVDVKEMCKEWPKVQKNCAKKLRSLGKKISILYGPNFLQNKVVTILTVNWLLKSF